MSFSTAVVGFGRIAHGYADDSRLGRHKKYATHAQVLRDHPAFVWDHVVDPDPDARRAAGERWDVPDVHADVDELPDDVDVAVVATPADVRRSVVEALPDVEAVVLEKPLGGDLDDAEALVEHLESRGVVTQVNLWRRADATMRRLADGDLAGEIGDVQAVFGVYGAGIQNNGTHVIDLVRMLVGEVVSVRALGPATELEAPGVPGDVDVPVALDLASGPTALLQTLDFDAYRDMGLDLWGTTGRLSILNVGLDLLYHPVQESRQLEGEREIDHGDPTAWQPTVGEALYELYDDLAGALQGDGTTCSPARSALATAEVVEAAIASAAAGGEPRQVVT